MCKEQTVESVTGSLAHFLIIPHEQLEEHYVCLQSFLYSDQILFYVEGGADVGDVGAKAETMDIDSGEQVAEDEVVAGLLGKFADEKKAGMNSYIVALFKLKKELHFAYLEINSLVISADGSVVPLDLAAMVDGMA